MLKNIVFSNSNCKLIRFMKKFWKQTWWKRSKFSKIIIIFPFYMNLIWIRLLFWTPFDLKVIKLCPKDGYLKYTHDTKYLFRHFKSHWVSSDKTQLKPVSAITKSEVYLGRKCEVDLIRKFSHYTVLIQSLSYMPNTIIFS